LLDSSGNYTSSGYFPKYGGAGLQGLPGSGAHERLHRDIAFDLEAFSAASPEDQ
jgi:hypothetical protein